MKKRIKYFSINGWIISENILCNGELLHIRICVDGDKLIYSVSNTVCSVHSGRALSISSAKRLAKVKLIELGAIFGDEVRKKDVI